MPNRRTRNRQLARLAQQRYAERRARERRRRLQTIAVAVVVSLAGVGLAGFAFGVFEGDEPAAAPTHPASVSPSTPPSGEGLSCPKREPIPPRERPTYEEPPEMAIDTSRTYTATMHTSKGTILLDLFADRTPITVNNFVTLSCDGFYDGLTFHRIVPGFVIQGGDPKGDGTGGPGYQFEDEIVPSLTFDRAGLLAMANSGPGTNGSQFFITLGPAEHLNGKHTIFGAVAKGTDVVDEIAAVRLNGESPAQPVTIETIEIDES